MHKLIFPLLVILTLNSVAQELNCNIQVSSPQIQGSDRRIYETLQRSLYEFINNRRWTNYSFKLEERIECTMAINITERISTDEFKATINLQIRRPVYNTSYNSVLLNYIDKDFQFRYIESQTLDYIDNSFTSNLTSVIAFYVNIFLGLDFDSFSLNGGTPFFLKAQSIVNSAQNAKETGWKAFEGLKNRYWLIENLLNSSYGAIRQAEYKYHREGLDIMTDNVENGRAAIFESLEMLRKVNREKPDLFLMNLVMTAKADEIVNIFSEAAPMNKTKAFNLLSEIDPANISKYQKILGNK